MEALDVRLGRAILAIEISAMDITIRSNDSAIERLIEEGDSQKGMHAETTSEIAVE